ncbi:hypothetical protein DRF60_20030 [Chryseobacterium elymi]|uniref:Uncharacterized protein n=1 Tax=Chryseobacterium elymi TaxID=395936 RepID=A0A3D9D465_9FLAO|nr:hypothetical protein DRF60_20030 [Chryseobacterium elymi]
MKPTKYFLALYKNIERRGYNFINRRSFKALNPYRFYSPFCIISIFYIYFSNQFYTRNSIDFFWGKKVLNSLSGVLHSVYFYFPPDMSVFLQSAVSRIFEACTEKPGFCHADNQYLKH